MGNVWIVETCGVFQKALWCFPSYCTCLEFSSVSVWTIFCVMFWSRSMVFGEIAVCYILQSIVTVKWPLRNVALRPSQEIKERVIPSFASNIYLSKWTTDLPYAILQLLVASYSLSVELAAAKTSPVAHCSTAVCSITVTLHRSQQRYGPIRSPLVLVGPLFQGFLTFRGVAVAPSMQQSWAMFVTHSVPFWLGN